MKITRDIHIVGGNSESCSSDASIYLVKSKNEAALIDSGTGEAMANVLENIGATGTDVTDIKYLFLTHCHYDHCGGADKIREITGCKIVAHELDAQYLESGDSEVTAASWYGTFIEDTKVDIKVSKNKEEFKVGDLTIKFYHTPGHSPGSSIVTVESEKKLVLFGQDVHGPLNEVLLSNRNDYEKSLEFMISLNADILCEGHFGIYSGKESVKKFIESFL